MSFETIQLDIADDVALLTLDRPDKLNSFTTVMHAELREALKAVRKANPGTGIADGRPKA